MKKTLSIFLVLVLIFAITRTPDIKSNTDQVHNGGTINLIDAFENPEDHENIKIGGPYSHKEILEILQKEENMTLEEATRAAPEPTEKSSTQYLTIGEVISYNSSVAVEPVFYCEVKFEGTSPIEIIAVRNVSLKLDAGRRVKPFNGNLYYNLESSKGLYYNLNGDLYRKGTMTSSGGNGVRVGEDSELNLDVPYANNNYGYIYRAVSFRM